MHDSSREHSPGDSSAPDSGFTGIGQVSETAVRLTGVDGAAVALLSSTAAVRELVYATDTLAQRLDELQFTLGEGPCIDAYTSGVPQLVDDLGAVVGRNRWPVFVSDASALGAAAVFAYPIISGSSAFGVLELYRGSAGGLDSAEQAAATTCALAVGNTLIQRFTPGGGEQGGGPGVAPAAASGSRMDGDRRFTRADVYVAAGMVAVQLEVSVEEALDRLRAFAYQAGRPLGEVAHDILTRKLSLREHRDTGGDR